MPQNPALVLHELLRRDFCAFARKAWAWISAGEPAAWNWHLEAIAYQLDRVARGENLRLIVTIPPRNGKSKIISVIWVAWMLGQDPTLNFVGVSYSNDLSGKLARDCLSIVQAAWYRKLFPQTIISAKRSAAMDFETTRNGGRLATSVTGTLTGRGGDIIILDDVIKPDDAISEAVRNSVNDWYRSTLASRLNDKKSGAIILVMQRLHQYDLVGMLLEAGGWEQLKLAAIATQAECIELIRGRVHHRAEGELLHPSRESIEELDNQRAAMGSMLFAAQYQQDPVPAVGNLISAQWLRTFDQGTLDMSYGQIVLSLDTASKDNPYNDYSAFIIALVQGKSIYIVDVFRARLQFPDLKAKVVELARTYAAAVLLIEDASSGQQLIQTLRAENPKGVPLPIARKPNGAKSDRVMGASAMIQAGRLFLPTRAHWLAEFVAELLGFPAARFDDQVDALAQLLIWVQEKDIYRIIPNAGPELIEVTDSSFYDDLTSSDSDYDPWGA